MGKLTDNLTKRISFIHDHGKVAMAFPQSGMGDDYWQFWVSLDTDKIIQIQTQIENALKLAKAYDSKPKIQWSDAKVDAYENVIRTPEVLDKLVQFFADRNITGEDFFEDMYVRWRRGMDDLLEQFIDETPGLRQKINGFIEEY